MDIRYAGHTPPLFFYTVIPDPEIIFLNLIFRNRQIQDRHQIAKVHAQCLFRVNADLLLHQFQKLLLWQPVVCIALLFQNFQQRKRPDHAVCLRHAVFPFQVLLWIRLLYHTIPDSAISFSVWTPHFYVQKSMMTAYLSLWTEKASPKRCLFPVPVNHTIPSFRPENTLPYPVPPVIRLTGTHLTDTGGYPVSSVPEPLHERFPG